MVVIGFLFLALVTYLLNGLALSLLWGWFMVPVLGLPVISVTQAIGIAIVIGLLTHQHIPREEGARMQIEMILYELFVPLFAVFVGFIVHLFM